jgi:hypothetical protein
MDDRLAKAKQLIADRSRIDGELVTLRGEIEAEVTSLFSSEVRSKKTAVRVCGECGKEGHNKKTCPSKK